MSQPNTVASSFAAPTAVAGQGLRFNRATRDALATMLAFALFVVAGVVALSAMVPEAPADLAMPVLLDTPVG